MTTFEAIRDAALIRDPQPTDVLVLRVGDYVRAATVKEIGQSLSEALSCRVVVLSEQLRIEAFDGVIR